VPYQGCQARTCYYLLASFAVLGILVQGKGKKPGTWREGNTGVLGTASAVMIGYCPSPLCRLGHALASSSVSPALSSIDLALHQSCPSTTPSTTE
jgi:hypothetical protein